MMKFGSALVVASLLVLAPAALSAAPCKDAKGKFIKCPPKAAAPAKKGPCRDAKGHFKKC